MTIETTPQQFAWIYPDGRWATYSEHTTHTGTHRTVGLTEDINKAYVAVFPPWRGRCPTISADGIDVRLLLQLPVELEQIRKVRIVPSELRL